MEQMTFLNQLAFWTFAAMMIGGAIGVVFHRSIVYSALHLLVAFLSIAAMFVLLNAPFLAAAQILVYGVGLTIVLIFGIMLTGDKPFADPVGQERPNRYWIIPGIIAMGTMAFLMWALLYPNAQLTAINGLFTSKMEGVISPESLEGLQAVIADGGASYIGQLLFSKYLVAFELASILLLLAMIGAIVLSKRELPEEEGEAPLSHEIEGGPAAEKSLHEELKSINERGLSGVTGISSDEAEEKETLGVH